MGKRGTALLALMVAGFLGWLAGAKAEATAKCSAIGGATYGGQTCSSWISMPFEPEPDEKGRTGIYIDSDVHDGDNRVKNADGTPFAPIVDVLVENKKTGVRRAQTTFPPLGFIVLEVPEGANDVSLTVGGTTFKTKVVIKRKHVVGLKIHVDLRDANVTLPPPPLDATVLVGTWAAQSTVDLSNCANPAEGTASTNVWTISKDKALFAIKSSSGGSFSGSVVQAATGATPQTYFRVSNVNVVYRFVPNADGTFDGVGVGALPVPDKPFCAVMYVSKLKKL